MLLYPYPNPALNTCWQHVKPGEKKNYRVTAIWGVGAKEHYRVISYELTPLTGGTTLRVPVEKMIELIRKETLILL